MIRALIERLSRNRVMRRRLPPQFGSRMLAVSPDAALQYLKPDWTAGSKDLLAAAERSIAPGYRVWDIGGNVGVFAFAAAHRAGPNGEVVAVEPDPFLAGLLQTSAGFTSNQDMNVHVLCAAVSDNVGIARFKVAARGRASNSLEQVGHRSQACGSRCVQHVPTITLDSMLNHFSAPNFLKIDVEGAEVMVIAGAKRVLSECRPTIYIEVGKQQSMDVTRQLKGYEYTLLDGDARDRRELSSCVWNTLAVPSESLLANRTQ